MIEREESRLATHRSNPNTDLCNSQVDHDDTPRSLSNNVRSPPDTPERRKRASEHCDSSRSEQKYNQETRLTQSDTLSTDSVEDDSSDKTNKTQHSDMDETSETYQHNTPNEESKPEDVQQRIKIHCDKVQSKILFMNKDTNKVLHSQKETSSENVYLTHITTNMLLSLRLMLNN